jgi:hypothetical protein
MDNRIWPIQCYWAVEWCIIAVMGAKAVWDLFGCWIVVAVNLGMESSVRSCPKEYQVQLKYEILQIFPKYYYLVLIMIDYIGGENRED